MREANSMGTMRGVGINPVLAWGRLKIVAGEDPVLEHGLGVTMEVVDGKLTVQIDHGIRPRFWTPFATVIGSTDGVFVESFDEAAGSFIVALTPTTEEPPAEEPAVEEPVTEPPAEEPAAEEPAAETPAEEPAEEPEEEPAAFAPTPVAADGAVYVSVLVLGVGQ